MKSLSTPSPAGHEPRPAPSDVSQVGPGEHARTAGPVVSVVIPCYNQAHYLRFAIESVRRQDYSDKEVIVVDDGSTDGTGSVAASFPFVRCVTQDNRGLAAARNAGLSASHGEFVIFLDADDTLLPGAIQTGARLLAADASLAFVAGQSRFITSDGIPQPTEQPIRASSDPYVALLTRNSIRNPAMVMFRRKVLDQAGGFDSRVDACADYEMYLRIARAYPVAFHTGLVAEYRKHAHNMSSDAALMIRQLRVVIRAQRSYLVTPERRSAYRIGRRNVLDYYGDKLATQIRERVRAHSEWRKAIVEVATLVRCHPRGAVEHAQRKFLCWWRGEQEGTRQPT
jgi:glycosyltransferase involved in cell wall biosynthesis